MKRIVSVIAAGAIAVAGIVTVSPSASASDTQPIVDGWEQRAKANERKSRVWVLPKACKNKQAQILYKAGFNKPGLLRGAWAITWRESHHQALDESSPWYSGALGTWQIQTSAWSGRSWWSRSNMLDKYTQSTIVRKHFLKNGMHNWGLGYSFKRDEWYFNTGMYDQLWGSSLTYAWVIQPYEEGWAMYPKSCR